MAAFPAQLLDSGKRWRRPPAPATAWARPLRAWPVSRPLPSARVPAITLPVPTQRQVEGDHRSAREAITRRIDSTTHSKSAPAAGARPMRTGRIHLSGQVPLSGPSAGGAASISGPVRLPFPTVPVPVPVPQRRGRHVVTDCVGLLLVVLVVAGEVTDCPGRVRLVSLSRASAA